jgi:hypothetical protein
MAVGRDRAGLVDAVAAMSRSERTALRRRFDSHVDRSGGPDACHRWTGAITAGYGSFNVGGRREYAHRVALALAGRLVDDGRVTDHRCHSVDLDCPGGPTCPHRRCVNTAHLRRTSFLLNVRAGRSGQYRKALSARRRRCRYGHPFTDANTVIVSGRKRCRACARLEARARRRTTRPSAVQARGPLRAVAATVGGRDRLSCGHRLPADPRWRRRRCSRCDVT